MSPERRGFRGFSSGIAWVLAADFVAMLGAFK